MNKLIKRKLTTANYSKENFFSDFLKHTGAFLFSINTELAVMTHNHQLKFEVLNF